MGEGCVVARTICRKQIEKKSEDTNWGTVEPPTPLSTPVCEHDIATGFFLSRDHRTFAASSSCPRSLRYAVLQRLYRLTGRPPV